MPVPEDRPLDVFLAVCDHFEPLHQGASPAEALRRVDRWRREFPAVQAAACDHAGRPPRHTFFYPIEQGSPELWRAVADLAHAGAGEIEVHLHHRDDTAASLRAKLDDGVGRLAELGALTREREGGRPHFAFVHGNWALDHSHPEGRACGVANELEVLQSAGCYADFTFPCAPDPCQPRTINSIYYAYDTPEPKSHDRGVPARAGSSPPEQRGGPFLLVQGPLGLNWRRRKWGILPRLENADLTAANPPTLGRFAVWRDLHVHVSGRPEWLFIKLHTHGCKPGNDDMLLGGPLARFYADLAAAAAAAPAPGMRLHFVTAREMANLVHAAEVGWQGDPTPWRDFRWPRPPGSAGGGPA